MSCRTASKFTTDAWKGKKVVLFAVPGAFTVSGACLNLT